MKEISEEVYDIAKTLYDDDIIQYTIDRSGKALIDSEHIPDIEDYIYYYGEAKETDFNKALEVIQNALDKVKFYDGYLELNDNHTLWNINAPEDNMLFNEDAYSFIVTVALEHFRAETDTDLYLLGRMGRHAVVDNNFSNLMRYDELKQVQQKYEQEVISQAQETCFYKEDLTEGLAKGEKVTKCQECGSSIIYTKKDLQEDLDGNYIKCPNCSSFVDLAQETKKQESYGETKYNVSSYYGKNFTGLEDSLNTNNYDEAEAFIWEKVQKGNTVECTDTETGDKKRYSPETHDYGDETVGIEDYLVENKKVKLKKTNMNESYEVWQKYYEDGKVTTEYVQTFDTFEKARKFADGLNQDPDCEAWVKDLNENK